VGEVEAEVGDEWFAIGGVGELGRPAQIAGEDTAERATGDDPARAMLREDEAIGALDLVD
jgi:hypothetical protein